jgi:Zn-dependent M28 family amino/carboxypeptidase
MKADVDRLKEHVTFLTSIQPARNYRNTGSLEKVCSYLEETFRQLGALPVRQTWTADGREYHNIIASYNTEKSRRLVVGAHYDVCGDGPGADDNASAVAGLLETARLVFSQQPPLDYRIDFVAYCLEEPPFFATTSMGSYVHASSLQEEKATVIGMICYEMIGYFSDEPGSQPYPSPELAAIYPSTANFIVVVGIKEHEPFNLHVHRLMKQDAGIDVQVISFPGRESLASLSDQRSYWMFGYPALMINDTAFIRNPNYHTQNDTADTLDFPKMAEVVSAAYRAVTGFSE